MTQTVRRNPKTVLSQDILLKAVQWRHHLHGQPELAYQETRTAHFIAGVLSRLGFKVHQGLGETGVVGTLSRGTNPRVVAIRADMDALPITEQSGAGYASIVPGTMHACGHDGHVAIALAAAAACTQMPDLDGTVRFIFQPAEENEGGAKRMVEDGLFDQFPCDWIYALHNWPALPLGSLIVRDACVLAALGTFEISISGRGCHGALPHEGTDVLVAGCQLVTALQTIVSRNVDPRLGAVVSATQIRAGDTWNVIADTCVIRGTTRWFDDSVGDTLERRLKDISTHVARSYGCEAQVQYDRRIPPTINDAQEAAFVRKIATSAPLNLTVVDTPPSTGSEDFAYMLREVPGCYVLMGSARSGENPNLHSPSFDFNDAVLPLASQLWVSVIQERLGST